LLYTLVAGNKPLLGLDLQGGVSVVLKPVQEVDNDTIDQAIAIIRQRIDAIGVAEPEITRQGSNILIQIPGVKDKERALELVGQTAELQFRPVLANVPIDPQEATTTTSGDPAATTTTAPGAPTTTIDPTKTVGGLSLDVCTAGMTAEEINATGQAVLPQCQDGVLVGSYAVGPVSLTGSALETARANLGETGQWVVAPIFKSGSDGIGGFNAVAGQCFSKGSTCPTGQLAIVLDGRVLSAPSINSQSFKADQIEISGSFTERTAKDLATALKYGALPVEFEQQQAQVVAQVLPEWLDMRGIGVVRKSHAFEQRSHCSCATGGRSRRSRVPGRIRDGSAPMAARLASQSARQVRSIVRAEGLGSAISPRAIVQSESPTLTTYTPASGSAGALGVSSSSKTITRGCVADVAACRGGADGATVAGCGVGLVTIRSMMS
jgi:protein-export membrane protein SecD